MFNWVYLTFHTAKENIHYNLQKMLAAKYTSATTAKVKAIAVVTLSPTPSFNRKLSQLRTGAALRSAAEQVSSKISVTSRVLTD